MSIQVLVTGKVGVGKQTLVNQLIGENVSETGEDLLGVTRELVKGTTVKNGILINICDTPGLGDADLEDYDTLQNARGECGEIDLFLFCIKITDRFERIHNEAMENITDIFGRDIWKKAMFVLTFANEYKPDEKFVDKVKAWTQQLKKRISKISGLQVGNKVPVIPAGHTAPKLPDRASWISEFWIQGFRRMGFKAMVKLYIINQERTTEEMKSSQEMYTTPDEQPLIACYNTTVEDFKSKHQMHMTGSCVGLVIGSAIELIVKYSILHYKFYIMPFIGAYLGLYIADEALNYFGWSVEKEVVDCHEEAIVRSLILAFIEEYPEYVNDDTYQKVKDKLDFKTVTKEEL